MDLFNQCLKTVESCLIDAKMGKSDIHDVVLVGGFSRIPKVQQLLQDFFAGKDLCKVINPDEAVAYVAVVQASLMSEGFKNVPNLVLQDVAPLSLGIEIQGGIMDVVISRNTNVPVKKTVIYSTIIDNQACASIVVYEGERARARENNLLGSFNLCGLPHAPRGHPLEVCFVVDANGILIVSAIEKSTGSKNEITITNEKAENYRAADEQFLKKANAMNALDYCVYKIKNSLEKKDMKLKLSSQENEKIKFEITKVTHLLNSNQQSEISVLENHLNELESLLQFVIGKYV